MELIKETVKLAQSVYKGETQVMSDGDITVPDIKPDILKLLQVDAVSCITETEVYDGRLDICGKVYITILYIPDRDGEKIRSVDEVFEFSHKVENRNICAGMEADVISNVIRVEFSAVNSRRVRIKAIIGLDYEILGINEIEIPSGMPEEAQIKTETVKLRNSVEFSTHEFNVREKIEIPGGQPAINEILKTDVRISDTDYKTVSGKIVIKGVVGVCALYTDDNLDIKFTEAELPFTEVFDAPEVSDDTICDIEYSVCFIQSNVEEDSDGERTVIGFDILIKARIKGEEEVEIEMITDCYIPREKTVIKAAAVETEEYSATPSVQNTIREVIEFPDGMPPVSGIYNVITRASVTKAQIQGGKLQCEGKTEAYILYISESNDNPVYSLKKELPFSYMLECEGAPEDAEPRIQAEIRHTSYNLNAAGEAELRCILSLSANIINKRKINVIESVETDDSKEIKNGIVIYFVQNGDTLWNIAKHYGVPYEEILEFNKLEDEGKIYPGQRLFIP